MGECRRSALLLSANKVSASLRSSRVLSVALMSDIAPVAGLPADEYGAAKSAGMFRETVVIEA